MGALSSIRILDLTQWEAGPSSTQLLAWLGADVVKVEPPGRGESGRMTDRSGADSHYFLMLNQNKRAVTLNLTSEEGRDLFRRMLPRFDVLVENYTAGTMEDWGLGWEALREVHPGLIYVCVRGFGDSGPYAHFKSFDMIGQAAGGAMSVNGAPDGPPTRLGLTLGDTGTGVHVAVGILAAYVQRLETGRGQRVELSMQEAIMNYMRVAMLPQYMSGEPARRAGNPAPFMGADLYPCAPGGPNDYVYLVVQNPKMWEALAKAIGREELLGDPEFSDVRWRRRNPGELRAVVEPWTRERDKFTVMETLGEAGVPCSAVYDTNDVLTNRHLRERESVVTVEHPKRGTMEVPANPVRLADSAVAPAPAPLLGEHNAEVYRELLDLDGAELDRLAREGIV